jgi:lipopolysaccharide transport system ATP-binding protein
MTRIHLRNVDLHYHSVAFKDRSLKSHLAGLLFKKAATGQIHDIHALKKISVEIQAGERIGLLGHNGAGKTTFLKMLAGLYPISGGERQVEGRIRALFDLSLGFEPDASGRENILYRGLLLGMAPREVRAMESGIVAFADLGEFIDYPIKTYSAGMQVRLAFAISTAIGGDLLLIDEVIGAGDASFMVKAKARLQSLMERSEILILASHDSETLRSICQRGLIFHRGELVFDASIEDSIVEYNRINGVAPRTSS